MYWNNNRKILQQLYPGLLEAITKECNDGPEDIKVEPTPAGEPTLCVKGVYVHSRRDPLREGQRLADSISMESGAVVILGFGLGYAAQAAAKSGRPVIIVEKHAKILLKALESRDFCDFLSQYRLLFIIGGTGEGIVNALVMTSRQSQTDITQGIVSEDNLNNDKISVIRNKALTGLDEKWYSAVNDRIRAWTMKDEVNKATYKRFGQRWERNVTRNMSAIRDYPGILHLTGLACGKEQRNVPLPVFLAAAGPSLDNIKPLLRDIYDRCIIVAVDTSLRFFVNNGIQPDFVVVVDPQFWNSRHLDRCVDKQTALVAEPAVYPPVLRLPFNHKFLCSSMFPLGANIEKQVDQKGSLGAGGSVATTAWDFARILGSSQIWIAGLDLAYPELKTHFRGARFESLSNSGSCRFNPAEKWVVRVLRDGLPFKTLSAAGCQVLTDKRLSLYASWFESQFRRHEQVQNFCFFPAGLSIKGLKPAEIEKFLEMPKCREEIDSRIQSVFQHIENDFNAPDKKQKRFERYDKAISEILNNTGSIN